ncbi:unnamed protein product [Albugo candida]|uniref:Uncharacterized protein n=1 Tax=Albugo candida TaxID=65357 RepID=A0A024GRE9_9STRA|nr:unnamed protein product [Albugo candida]|eukprot:CCI49463.1 unnamed protein product [Albugo candida]
MVVTDLASSSGRTPLSLDARSSNQFPAKKDTMYAYICPNIMMICELPSRVDLLYRDISLVCQEFSFSCRFDTNCAKSNCFFSCSKEFDIHELGVLHYYILESLSSISCFWWTL